MAITAIEKVWASYACEIEQSLWMIQIFKEWFTWIDNKTGDQYHWEGVSTLFIWNRAKLTADSLIQQIMYSNW